MSDERQKLLIREAERLASHILKGADSRVTWVQERARGKRVPDEHLGDVAFVYRSALGAGHNPSRAVADHFDVPYSTATRWVMKARQCGKLGETVTGVAGESRADGRVCAACGGTDFRGKPSIVVSLVSPGGGVLRRVVACSALCARDAIAHV